MDRLASVIAWTLLNSPEINKARALLRRKNLHVQLGYYRESDTGWYYGYDGRGFLRWEDPDTIPWPGGLNSSGSRPAHAQRIERMTTTRLAQVWTASKKNTEAADVRQAILREVEILRSQLKSDHRAIAIGNWIMARLVPAVLTAAIVVIFLTSGVPSIINHFS